jgi:hypothetical protein
MYVHVCGIWWANSVWIHSGRSSLLSLLRSYNTTFHSATFSHTLHQFYSLHLFFAAHFKGTCWHPQPLTKIRNLSSQILFSSPRRFHIPAFSPIIPRLLFLIRTSIRFSETPLCFNSQWCSRFKVSTVLTTTFQVFWVVTLLFSSVKWF